MAMVKANAYGHGLVDVARYLEAADSLAVARLSEAAALRSAGESRPLVLLEGVFTGADLAAAAELKCELVVHNPMQVSLLSDYAGQYRFAVWLKIDSGMHRLGFSSDTWADHYQRLADLASVRDVRLMTHYASADDPADAQSTQQLQFMQQLMSTFDGPISLANSPALFRDDQDLCGLAGRDAHRVWLRPGIALYGLSPFESVDADALDLKPVMNFDARLISVQSIRPGDKVGYGGRFVAARDTCIGVVAAGYGDGYPRAMPDGTPVLVDGQRASIAGRVSMDMLTVDITDLPSARVGSEVRLWGAGLPAELIAAFADTISYELVTRVAARVRRQFVTA